MPKRKTRSRKRTLRGTAEQHRAAIRRTEDEALEQARAAVKFAAAGDCGNAIASLRRMGRAEGASSVHGEGAGQGGESSGLKTFASSATRQVIDRCRRKS